MYPIFASAAQNKKHTIDINFNGGEVSGNGGVLLLQAADEKIALTDTLAKSFPDPRNPNLITHSMKNLLRQRIYAIAAGYEDLNDHDDLRHDAPLQSGVGTLDH